MSTSTIHHKLSSYLTDVVSINLNDSCKCETFMETSDKTETCLIRPMTNTTQMNTHLVIYKIANYANIVVSCYTVLFWLTDSKKQRLITGNFPRLVRTFFGTRTIRCAAFEVFSAPPRLRRRRKKQPRTEISLVD